eukprot:CAMPEP_0119430698 /NCGR_PEP_ID=MMETSP1335-20130426/44583_1 /TAXON_ID=259385 /ORGANISM="Chrysoculter rhomboideus, Strain RCC1486" /LENGTH=276 /DNA_ID=CAMNT_0007456463 /DNA_START=20 /DNA_END=846 /DNA_ORIENTATION=+
MSGGVLVGVMLTAVHAAFTSPPPSWASAEPAPHAAVINTTIDSIFETLDGFFNSSDDAAKQVPMAELVTTLGDMRTAGTELTEALEVVNGLSANRTSIEHTIRSQATSALLQQALIDARVAFQQQATLIAAQIAQSRDKLHFSLAFYVAAFGANVLWICWRGRVEMLPLLYVSFLGGTILLAYNIDLAYGTKVERLNVETATILNTERHWFNEPVTLPLSVEPDYRLLMSEVNARRSAMGAPPERDWATFSTRFGENVWHDASPLSRLLHSHLSNA